MAVKKKKQVNKGKQKVKKHTVKPATAKTIKKSLNLSKQDVRKDKEIVERVKASRPLGMRPIKDYPIPNGVTPCGHSKEDYERCGLGQMMCMRATDDGFCGHTCDEDLILYDHSYEQQPATQSTPYEKWLEYWRLSCDWQINPEGWEAWNGGVQTATEYIFQAMMKYSIPVEELVEIRDKTRRKMLETIKPVGEEK